MADMAHMAHMARMAHMAHMAGMASLSSLSSNSMVDRSVALVLERWRHKVIARSSRRLPPCKISSGGSRKQVVLPHQLPCLLDLLMELLLLLKSQHRPILLEKPRLLLANLLQLLFPKLLVSAEPVLLMMLLV